MSLIECTKPMIDSPSSVAYTAYTHFYTHAESMCFYLQSKYEAMPEAMDLARREPSLETTHPSVAHCVLRGYRERGCVPCTDNSNAARRI